MRLIFATSIATYYHEIGVKVTPMPEGERTKQKLSKAEAFMHKMAKLTLPLEFAKPKSGKRR